MAHLRINVLGALQVLLEDIPVQSFESDKVRAGLKDILLGPGELYELLRERGQASRDLRELTRVVLRVPKQVGQQELPPGSAGTIVYAYEKADAYEVEFMRPFHAVLTVERSELEAVN